jgi:hypothetical protein
MERKYTTAEKVGVTVAVLLITTVFFILLSFVWKIIVNMGF